jgi:hypothetical protein
LKSPKYGGSEGESDPSEKGGRERTPRPPPRNHWGSAGLATANVSSIILFVQAIDFIKGEMLEPTHVGCYGPLLLYFG